VMGRGMEQFMVQTLVAEAKKRRIDKLVGSYCRTPKNSVVADFYATIGFQQFAATAAETVFVLTPGTAQPPALPIEDAPLAARKQS